MYLYMHICTCIYTRRTHKSAKRGHSLIQNKEIKYIYIYTLYIYNVYIYVHIYIYIYIYIYIRIHVYIYICICVCICIFICMHVYIYVCICICMCICICICRCICIFLCMHVYICNPPLRTYHFVCFRPKRVAHLPFPGCICFWVQVFVISVAKNTAPCLCQ